MKGLARMAASFRITRDPTAQFAEMRDRPRKDAERRARYRALARETLAREGFAPLAPGKPVLSNGVYAEWTEDPEPRFQLLVPLGRVRIAGARPRPATLTNSDGTRRTLRGTVGWRELAEGKWEASNDENDYLPMEGMRGMLAAKASDAEFVYFYYSATVRVEEESDDTRLTSVRWFLDTVPEVQRLWREGKLVTGGPPVD
jgi:hypothetical protein